MEVLYPLLDIVRLRIGTDGKGVSTLVAGAGCPLSCRWCINRRVLREKEPEWISPAALYERTKPDALYFEATGGGLCFGGGEALLHTRFLAAFRETIANLPWRITVETSLNVSSEDLLAAADVVDDFIVDVKTLDPDIYRSYTGADNSNVLRNLSLLASLVAPGRVKIRIPLIPGYNDQADREKTAAALKHLGFKHFDLFTYKTE